MARATRATAAVEKQDAAAGGQGRPRQAADRARTTATFEPYFWEAYNEIVRPDRRSWYTTVKWLPELGPEGFAILMALRARCYFNPRTGEKRDSVELTYEEIAAATGMSRSSVYRHMGKNEALARFVQKERRYVQSGRRIQQTDNAYHVCMDDPIHPGDMALYEELRAKKSADRRQQPGTRTTILKAPGMAAATRPDPHECQNDTHVRGHEFQSDIRASHSDTGQCQSDTPFYKESDYSLSTKTTAALAPPPAKRPPEGVAECPGPDAAALRARAEKELETEGSVAWKLAKSHAREGMIRARVGEIAAAAGRGREGLRT